jgi:thiol-disulfide isomerase/thioredoxin
MKKSLFSIVVIMTIISLTAAQNPELPLLPIGAQAPDFNLRGVDDKYYTLADFKEYDILMIVFWANHCPTAQAYEDRLIAMVNKYEPKGVGIVAISPNSPNAVSLAELGYSDLGDDFDDMVIRARDKGYNFPYLYDGDDHAGSIPYGPVATPHAYIFDKDRKLRYRGRIDDTENPYVTPNTSDAIDAIEALLAGSEVEVKETRTFGCSIKWKWADEWKKNLERQWAEAPVSVEMIDAEGIRELVANNGNKLRFINVWATWCGPCVIEFPELISIDRMYRGRAFEFISLSADNPNRKDAVLEFLTRHEAANKNYLYNATDKYALMDALDAEWQGALPHSLLIAPDGEIIKRYAGAIHPLTVRRDIVEYLGRYFADDDR